MRVNCASYVSSSSLDDRFSRSPSAGTPPAGTPNHRQFVYPPQISVESEAGYLASISRQSSFDAAALAEDTQTTPENGQADTAEGHQKADGMRLNHSLPSLSSRQGSRQEAGADTEHTLTPQFSCNSQDLSGAPLSPAGRKHALRRRSEVPQGYTTALTLKVPSGDMVEEDELDPVATRPRRASLDDVMMSVYRNFHKMPGSVK